MLEAQLPRDLVCQHGRLGHEQTDHVVGEEVDPQFLDRHLRALAAQLLPVGDVLLLAGGGVFEVVESGSGAEGDGAALQRVVGLSAAAGQW